ncbi:MAG: GAF domain-containing protein [Desulfovermiculus sp.]|nr:GAF domain-containing protein [Desulfovermiculus sp.]
MADKDYLSPFAIVNRAICEGADERQVVNLITKHATETLHLAGCFIKMLSSGGRDQDQTKKSLDLGRSTFKVTFSSTDNLELLSSYGLSQDFLYSRAANSPKSLFNCIPVENLYVEDITEFQEQSEDFELMRSEGFKALFMFPVDVYQENVAVVALFDSKKGDLNREDIKFAKALTSRGIASVVNQRNMEALLDRQRLFLSNFQEITNTINSTLNINKVLNLAVQQITDALGVIGTQIRLLDLQTQDLKLAASHGLSREFLQIGPVSFKRGRGAKYSLDAKHFQDIVVIDDIASDPRVQFKEAIQAEGANKMLTMPLHVRAKNIGELTIFTRGDRSFSEEEIQFADAVAQQCAFAIENARMYQRVKYEYQQLLEDFGYNGSS